MDESIEIVIVNYFTHELIHSCLEALTREIQDYDTQIHIVDNSVDPTEEKALKNIVQQLNLTDITKLYISDKNGGFAYGNNLALSSIMVNKMPSYIWLLNPDTIPQKNCLTELIYKSKANGDNCIVGSMLTDPDSTPQNSTFRFPNAISEFVGASKARGTLPLISQSTGCHKRYRKTY